MTSLLSRGLLFALLLLAAAPARAEAPTLTDMQEHIFGTSNIGAVAGHGGLTAGVSPDGDLTVLSFPGPSFADQLAFLGGNDLDVSTRPHGGAAEGMGSFLGLLVTTAQGTKLSWLRGADFTSSQRYTQPDAPVPETTFVSAVLKLSVQLIDVVSPDAELLTRRVIVTRAAGSPVTAASLVVYENLSPSVSRVPMIPFVDWLFDSRNDFVAAWDSTAQAVVHLHPSDRGVLKGIGDVTTDSSTKTDYGPVDALMKKTPSDAEIDAFVSGADSAFPPGVAAMVTTRPAPSSFQIGSDATPLCAAVGRLADNIKALSTVFPQVVLPLDPGLADLVRCKDPLPGVRAARGWSWQPEDALSDLADGKLSGSRLAACQTNAALLAPLAFTGDVAEGEALFAFGATLAAARVNLERGTALPAAARQAASEKAAHDALSGAALPDPALGQQVVDVARRALVNVYVARDRQSGAVVASISRQPPYYIDWPRDGAFINHGLDVAGLTSWVTQRNTFYAGLLRKTAEDPDPLLSPVAPTDPDTRKVEFPAGAWEMNYYADGVPGGNIPPGSIARTPPRSCRGRRSSPA